MQFSITFTAPFGTATVTATRVGISALDIWDDSPGPRSDERHSSTLKPAIPPEVATILECVRHRLQSGDDIADLPVDTLGTQFQQSVWNYLRTIPRGALASYAEVAAAIGRPSAIRAVARACACNTIALAIPCHRVVRSDGSCGGYRWGIGLKQKLLTLEGCPAKTAKQLKSGVNHE